MNRQRQGRHPFQIGQHQAKKPSPILTTVNTVHTFHHTHLPKFNPHRSQQRHPPPKPKLDHPPHSIPQNRQPPLNADKTWLAKAARYTMIGDDLYKRGYGQPLLKCVTVEQAQYIIKELHEGICGYHSGARTMATRVLRAGYFWPTIEVDCQDHVRKCKPCQKHDNLIH